MDRRSGAVHYNHRVALIGPKNAGKSTLVAAFLAPETIGTIQQVTISANVEFVNVDKFVDATTHCVVNKKNMNLSTCAMRTVRIIFTDTAGIDRMNKATEMIMRDTNVVLLCYDISDMFSLMKIAFSTGNAMPSATNPTRIGPKSATSKPSPDKRARFILVGCKMDKRSEAIMKFADDMMTVHPNMIHLWTASRESLLNGTNKYSSGDHIEVTKILCGDPLAALSFIEENSMVEDSSGNTIVIPYVFSDYVVKLAQAGDEVVVSAVRNMEDNFWTAVLTKNNEKNGFTYYSKFPVFDGMAKSFARYVTTCSACEYDNLIIDDVFETAAAVNRNVTELFTERIFTDVPLTITAQNTNSFRLSSSDQTAANTVLEKKPARRWRCNIL